MVGLREQVLAVEDAARSVTGVTNSEGGGAGHGRAQVALVTSHGFAGAYGGSSHSLWASVLAGREAPICSAITPATARAISQDLESADSIGLRAGTRAVSRLNPRRVPSGAMPIIFDPRVGGSIIDHLLGAMTGPAVTRKASFLLGKKGERILPEGLHVVDDPLQVRGFARGRSTAKAWPPQSCIYIDDGVLVDWLLDSALGPSARRTSDRSRHPWRRLAERRGNQCPSRGRDDDGA